MELVRQLRDQVTKHVRRTGKTVQKYDSRRVGGARFTVKKLSSPYGGMMISRHDNSSVSSSTSYAVVN